MMNPEAKIVEAVETKAYAGEATCRREENRGYVLASLAGRFDIKGQVQMHQVCVDSRWQWSEADNICKNASVRTILHKMAAPVRWIGTVLKHGFRLEVARWLPNRKRISLVTEF